MTRPFLRVAITPPYFYPGEAEAIEEKIRSGRYDYVHIRKPEASDAEIEHLIEQIDPQLRQALTVHYRFDVARSTGCGGIHLNARCPNAPEGWEGRVSRSCHTLAEVADAGSGLDYLFLSPIFPSISKPGYSSTLLSDPDLQATLTSAPAPVVALGGVTPSSLELIASLGFSGAAMLAEAWRSTALLPERFKLQLITHPYPGQSVVDGALKALQGGCRWIQLRHKNALPEQLIAEGKAIAALRSRFAFTFIIDDYVELVNEIGADGVHLGKNDMAPAEARLLLGPSKIIGSTANTLDDIIDAAKAGADYIGLGPFRFTTTKEKLSPTLGIDGYRDIVADMHARGIRLPVVAIGGITIDDIPAIMATGVDGVAVSGAILGAPSPTAATAAFMKSILNRYE